MSINEISRALGRLESGQEDARTDRAEFRQTVLELRNEVSAMNVTVSALGSQMSDMRPKVEAHEQGRWKRHGFVVGISMASGIGGTKLLALITTLLGGKP